MSTKKHIQAIFTFSKSVSKFITDANAFILALTTAPGNTYVTILPAIITTIQGHITTLLADEAEAAKRTEGSADVRDASLDVVKTDIRSLVSVVQLAADAAPNAEAAITIVHGCGLKTRKVNANTKEDFTATNDKNVSGLIRLSSKAAAPKFKASYEWQSSTNGINFSQIKITTQSRTTWLSGIAPGAKVFLRKRVITNKDVAMPNWSQTINLIVT